MGAGASSGRDNESLMDKLLESGYSLPPDVERAMRLVDRGSYFEQKSDRAYTDLAWRSGSLHLSAPSIYMTALVNLDLKPGLHFLNVGSGSGYLSTIIGLILGYNGINHGIELNSSNVEFSKTRLAKFLSESDAPFERDFCTPQFMQGNIFDLVVPSRDERTFASLQTTRPDADAPGSRPNPERSSSTSAAAAAAADEDNEAAATCPPSVSQADASSDPAPAPPGAAAPEQLRAEVENADSSDGEDDGPNIGSRGFVNDPWFITVEPPPLVEDHGADFTVRRRFVQWPLYDRIYVGASIQSVTQFLAVLRLLKIGGVMIAPVRDKFLKVTRRTEDVFDRINLLSVSFAPLISPEPETTASFDPPPEKPFPTLEQLTARVLRSVLRRVILRRHNDEVPTIGRLEEVDTAPRHGKRRNRSRQETDAVKKTNSDHSDEVKPSDHTSEQPGHSPPVETAAEQMNTDHPANNESEKPAGDHERCDNEQRMDVDDHNNNNEDEDEGADDEDDDGDDDDDDDEDEDGDEAEARSRSPANSSSIGRSRSPSNLGSDSPPLSRGSMARFFHHMLLRSGILQPTIVTENPVSTAREENPAGSASADQPDGSSVGSTGNPSEPRDSSIFLFRWIRNAEMDQPTESQDAQSTASASGGVASSSTAGAAEEQESTGPRESAESTTSRAPESSAGAQAQGRRVRGRKKRQPGLRFVPPNYQIKEEMHRILCDDLGMGGHYARLILTL